jgi:hypothetical protein
MTASWETRVRELSVRLLNASYYALAGEGCALLVELDTWREREPLGEQKSDWFGRALTWFRLGESRCPAP